MEKISAIIPAVADRFNLKLGEGQDLILVRNDTILKETARVIRFRTWMRLRSVSSTTRY